MRVSKNIILASTSLLIIIISLSSKQHMVVGQYQTVGMYYSENLAAGQIYQWNVTDFQINDTIWTLHNTDFQLGSNITIEITTDDIGQKLISIVHL